MHDTDLDHLRAVLGSVAGLDRLAPHVADAEREDAFCGHELVGFAAGVAA